MTLPIPPIQDIVRLVGDDVATTVENYRGFLAKSGGLWGYDPAKRLARAVFSHEMSRAAATRACSTRGHPSGRTSNAEVGGLIWDAASKREKRMCFPLKPQHLQLRPDFGVKVDPQFFFVEGGRPVIFYLQPRRGFQPSWYGLRLISSAIKATHAVDELEEAGLLLLDLSCPAGSRDRAVVEYGFDQLEPLPRHEVENFFQRFADAHDILAAEGVSRKKRETSKRKSEQDDLFDRAQP